jgi:hypothetical protein
MTDSMARRLFDLVEPVGVVAYVAEPTEAVMALGLPTMWDAYFAGRAAPLGRDVPATVVHALFYNFADGEVARHIPRRLWHGANLLREHRGDGHVAALLTAGVGGTEAHVLHALSEGMPADKFGRVAHLPKAQLAAVVDGMRARGLIGADDWLTAAGRQTKERVESLTDELAAPAYDVLEPDELDQLVEDLEPLAAVLVAAGSQ